MLVVIAIIVILSVLLFAGVKVATRAANSAKTLSNLRQTGVYLASYASDNNDRLPLSINWGQFWKGSGVWFQGTINGYFEELWSQRYSNSLRLNKIFYDPALNGKREHPWGSFGVNVSIVLNDNDCYATFGNTNGTPLAVISNPAGKVIYCSVAHEKGMFDSEWAFSGEEFAQKGMDSGITHPQPRNSGGVASLFVDGHVEKLDVTSMDRAARQRYFAPDRR